MTTRPSVDEAVACPWALDREMLRVKYTTGTRHGRHETYHRSALKSLPGWFARLPPWRLPHSAAWWGAGMEHTRSPARFCAAAGLLSKMEEADEARYKKLMIRSLSRPCHSAACAQVRSVSLCRDQK